MLRDGVVGTPPVPKELQNVVVMGVTSDSAGGVWIGTRDGAMWHYRSTGIARTPENEVEKEDTRALLQARDGAVWALDSGVSRYYRGVRTAIRARDSKFPFIAMSGVEMPDGSVVLDTRGYGLVRWINGTTEEYSERDGLSDAVVRGVLVDREANLWVATDAGLDRFRIAPFVTIGASELPPDLSPGLIMPARDGALWVQGSGARGMYQLDGGNINDKTATIRAQSSTALLATPYRFTLQAAAMDGGVWLTDNLHALHRLHDNRLTPFVVDYKWSGVIRNVLEDRRRGLWTASVPPNGLSVTRNGRRRAIRIPGATAESWASFLAEDSDGSIWAIGENPASIVKIVSDSVIQTFEAPDTLTESFSGLAIEGRDRVWTSIEGKLARIRNDSLRIMSMREIESVLRSSALVMLVAGDHLWVAGTSGIGRLPLAALHAFADGTTTTAPRVQWFNDLDGLSTGKLIQVNTANAFAAPDGRLWFSTPDGLGVVDPRELGKPSSIPTVMLEEVVTPETQFRPADFLKIPPRTDRIEIHFTATQLAIPERVRLQYRLDGADKSWVNAARTRSATYTQLQHGSYKFRVRALNENDMPGPETVMQLRVLPLWYESAWFGPLLIFVVATAGSMLVYAAFRTRTRIVADRMRARFEAEGAERARLARELHDTLLQGFTGITLQLQAVRQSVVHSPEHAQAALDRILSTADVSLREARTMVWDMRAPELDDQSLADAVRSVMHSAVGDSEISMQFAVAGNERKLPLGIETAVLRVARESIANTVKHARASRVDINIDYSDRLVTLTISDNGCGFDETSLDAKANGGHWGLKGMQERAARARGELRIRSGAGEGTTVELVLPTSHPE